MSTKGSNSLRRVISHCELLEVRFNILKSGTGEILYESVVNIVVCGRHVEADIYRTAEDAARSWGAFGDPDTPMAVDHQFHDRQFAPVSINRIAQVDGINRSAAGYLADSTGKMSWD